MDNEAVDTINKSRLHRKVATVTFFESNGGQTRDEATVPELRLDVAEPDLDVGNVETVLETLGTSCYYLTVEGNRYRFSMKANLNRLLADRRANIPAAKMDERILAEVQKVFSAGAKVDRVFFPAKSGQVPDRPVLTFAVLPPDSSLAEGISPNYLARNWPPAFKEWSTKSVRDAFFASPQFPRLLNGDVVRDTIAKGVSNGQLAYVGKGKKGYDPFLYAIGISAADVEISEQMFIVTKDVAEEHLKGVDKPVANGTPPPMVTITGAAPAVGSATDAAGGPAVRQPAQDQPASVGRTTHNLTWTGEVPARKWMNFYMKVLSRFATASVLKISLKVEVTSTEGIPEQKVEETKVALRELGLRDDVGEGRESGPQ